MEDKSQNDVDAGPITPFREGYLANVFGQFLYQNPYKAYGDVELDDVRYYEWLDGWNSALKHFVP